MQWLEFDSLVNARDVGGTPTADGGVIRSGRLLRSDNLQDLTEADVERLIALGVTDVLDLRSAYEVHHEGPGPLIGDPRVRIHHHSFFVEKHDDEARATDDDGRELPGNALPYTDRKPTVAVDDLFASVYLSFLVDRPDSVLAALQVISRAEGATLVHCAAGKDRTGTTVALAMLIAGAERDAVVADYAASSQRVPQIVARLRASDTYRDSLTGTTDDQHMTHPESMRGFLEYVDLRYGGVPQLLAGIGWTDDDSARMWAKLRD